VRQAVAYAALTRQALHLVNARARRSRPGLRRQHLRAVEAVAELVGGRAEGAAVGAREFVFHPGEAAPSGDYGWEIGSAGSTTALALALLPVLAVGAGRCRVRLTGGLFQDFSPSPFHLQAVVLPLLERMGVTASLQVERPGYVPAGGGVLALDVTPPTERLRPLQVARDGEPRRVWGVALSSRLRERRVSERLAETARAVLSGAGYDAEIEPRYDESASQPGAALAAFAEFAGGARLGADRAGAPRRSSEAIGRYVARRLLAELASGADVDHFTADQIIPFAALAEGVTTLSIPEVTEHVESGAWLAGELLGAEIEVGDRRLTVHGVGFVPRAAVPSER
jgi:RNA 3'-terminal phosphate cyclase (ATP)